MTSRGVVMVIDGDAETRELLSTYLDRIGYEACVASSRQQAVDLLHGRPAALAIVCETALRSTSDSSSGSPPVLFMTTSRDPSRPSDITINKPFQLIDFGDQLLRLVRQRKEAP